MQRAIEEGADFIESDILASKDGALICFHDVTLDDTTDVAKRKEFANRRRTYEVEWFNVTGWFVGLHRTTNPDSFTPFVITILIYISATWNVVKQQGNNNASLLCFLDSTSGFYYKLIYTGTLFTYNMLAVWCYLEGWNENDKLVSFWKEKKTRPLGKDCPTALMLGRCKPLLCLEKILKVACPGGTPCACC